MEEVAGPKNEDGVDKGVAARALKLNRAGSAQRDRDGLKGKTERHSFLNWSGSGSQELQFQR